MPSRALPQHVVEAGLGEDDADVRQRRLREHAGDVAVRLALERLGVVPLDDARRLVERHRRPEVALARDDPAGRVERRDRLVDRAVVAPVEDEDLERCVICRASRIANRFASVAVSANCQRGSPKRRASSSATSSASSLGSMRVIPRAACSATARTVGSGEWPAIAPVSPRQKSTYSIPSTSRKRAPCASAAKTGSRRPSAPSSASVRRRASTSVPARRGRASADAHARSAGARLAEGVRSSRRFERPRPVATTSRPGRSC